MSLQENNYSCFELPCQQVDHKYNIAFRKENAYEQIPVKKYARGELQPTTNSPHQAIFLSVPSLHSLSSTNTYENIYNLAGYARN